LAAATLVNPTSVIVVLDLKKDSYQPTSIACNLPALVLIPQALPAVQTRLASLFQALDIFVCRNNNK